MSRSVRAATALALSLTLPLGAQDRTGEQLQVALGLQQRGLHEEAVRYFAEFLKAQPGHPQAAEASYRCALSELELGRAPGATAHLQQALQLGGTAFRLRAEARYRLGNLFAADGKHREAAEQYDGLLGEVPADHYLRAPAAYAAGEAWRDLGDDARAASAFAMALAAATGDQASFAFPAAYQLGFATLRSGDVGKAAEQFGAAAARAPDAAAKGECLYLVGDAQLRAKHYTAAEQSFAAAEALPSEFVDDACFGRGWAALGRGDQAAAQQAFAAVVEQHADSPLAARARLELGRSLYLTGHQAEAQQQLQPLLTGGGDDDLRRQARELSGLCALATGAGEAALATLQKSLAEAPAADRPRLSYALGEACANLGRWQDALAAYDAVPPDAPPDLRGDALYGACFALHSLGRHEESLARATAVAALSPKHRLHDEACFARAENLFVLRRYEEAERAYGDVAGLAAYADRAKWKSAWCHYLRGEHPGAAERFAQIAGGQTTFAEEALAMQALALLEAGQPDAALATADRYRARFANGAFLDRTERIAARVLRERGDLAAAQKRLDRAAAAAQSGERSGEVRGDRLEQAELAYLQGDYRGADQRYAEVTGDDALAARALAGRAWCAFELGDDDACLGFLEAGLKQPAAAGELAGLLELQTALHHRRAEWPQAIAAAQQFLARFADQPKAPSVRYSLGVAEARSGAFADARQTLAALLADGSYAANDRVAYELAWACRRAGDEPAALAGFARVVELTHDAELAGEADLHLGVARLEANDLAAARPLLERVQGPHRGRALYRLGFAEFTAAGDDAKLLASARDRFGELAALRGEELAPEGLFLGAECCRRLGDPRGVAERLQVLLKDHGDHPRADRARLLLGEAAVALGDGNLAVAPLDRFLRDELQRDQAQPDHRGEPGDALRARLALGRARALRGEHEAAERELQQVVDGSDSELGAEALFRIGECRAARGDLAAAADAYVKLPILYAHPEWARRGLLQAGLTYERLQQPDKAQRFFRELVDKHADSAEAKTAREHLRDQ